MWTFINIHSVVNLKMHNYAEYMSRVLRMKDPRATSFLSNTVGVKLNVEDVNSDKMIDSQFTVTAATERSVKDAVV